MRYFRSTDIAKHLFEWPKCSLWNIKCDNVEYVDRPSCEYPPGNVSLTGASISGVATALTNKYQTKLTKAIKLVDTMTLASAVFEKSVSKALKDGRVNKQKFSMLQMFYLGTLNALTNIDHKMEAETRTQLLKAYWTRSTT